MPTVRLRLGAGPPAPSDANFTTSKQALQRTVATSDKLAIFRPALVAHSTVQVEILFADPFPTLATNTLWIPEILP